MFAPKATLNHAGLDRSIKTLLQLGGAKEVAGQFRLLAEELVKLTPPRARPTGTKRVTRDLRRAVKPMGLRDWESPTMRKAIKRRDLRQVEFLLNRLRKTSKWQWRVYPFSAALHQAARGSGGDVREPRKIVTLDAKPWRDYLRRLVARVGFLKASWAPAARSVRAKLPSWVASHKRPKGSVQNHLRDSDKPAIAAISFGRGIVKFMAAPAQKALRARASKIAGRIRHLLKAKAAQAKL